jgi:hypothetical protein
MTMSECAERYMGTKIFTSAELLNCLSRKETPATVQRVRQLGGNPLITFGMILHHSIGIEKVGIDQTSVVLWQVRQ